MNFYPNLNLKESGKYFYGKTTENCDVLYTLCTSTSPNILILIKILREF